MYNLPYFKENDQDRLIGFIQQNPFAFIAGCDTDNNPVASQVPLFIEERNGKLFLTGHIMKNTDHHKAFMQNPKLLCVFTGAHTYVSATWYSNPHQASTWNYMSVHLHGIIRFTNEDVLIDILKKTTLHFEGGNSHSSTTYDNLPEDYRNNLIKAIAGFEIEVLRMENVFKLSQNRDEESYHNIISKLYQQDANAKAIAEEMEKRSGELYK